MRRDPVPRDIDAACDPHFLVADRIVEKALERGGAPGPPGEPAMQPDRHHARPRFAFAVQHVEAVLQIGEELVAGVEALRCCEAHIVRIEGIGHDQLRLAA